MRLSTTIFKKRLGPNGHAQYEIEPGRWVSRQRMHQLRDRQARAAHEAVQYAIAIGRIKRLPCEVCGNEKSQAHHPKHSKPLKVVWLCAKHHAEQPRRKRVCNRPFQPKLKPGRKPVIRRIRWTTRRKENQLRAAVWARDGGLDRATGQPVFVQHHEWDKRGECCHIRSKGAHPELKYDSSNVILLSARNHWLSDARGGCRLKIYGDDARQPLRFVMHDKHGQVLWERVG